MASEFQTADRLDLDALMSPLEHGVPREVWNSSTYWEAQGMEFREMGPDEPIPPPNVIAHWVQDGVAYWVVGSPGPTPITAAIASRDIFRRKLRAAGVPPRSAAVQSATLWRHVERAVRPQLARAAAQTVERTRANQPRPAALKSTVRASGPRAKEAPDRRVTASIADRQRARLNAEVREASARAARRAAARERSAARKTEEGPRRDLQLHA